MYGTQNHPTYFMPHSVQPELASCQCGDPCWVSLGIFFTSALSFFSFFSLHLPQPLRHFSLHWAVGERKDQAFQFLFTDSFLMLVCFFFLLKKCILILSIWIHYEILLVENKQILCFVHYRLLHYLFAAFLTIPDFSILLPFSLLLAICLQKQNRQAW